MPNYQHGKIYQIVCLTTGQKYIGSTTQATLALRLAGHVRDYRRWKKGKFDNVSSFTILEGGNYQIELLETCPCNSKDELNAREGHYIRTLECVNKNIAGRTRKETQKAWYESHKTEIQAYDEAHKTERKAYMKAYYEKNKLLKTNNIEEKSSGI